jgi:hypothetical protein
MPGADIPRPEVGSERPEARAPARFRDGPFRLAKGKRSRAPCLEIAPEGTAGLSFNFGGAHGDLAMTACLDEKRWVEVEEPRTPKATRSA